MKINPNILIPKELTAKDNPQHEKHKLKEACYDFEALLLARMLKEMRKTAGEDSEGYLFSSSNQFQGMFDWELSRMMARSSSIGIAESMMKSFGLNNPDLSQVDQIRFERMDPDGEPLKSIIETAARNYDIDPALVRAVIICESSANRFAVSPKNAKGLMQIIDETAERFGVSDPFDAEQNVNGGTAYLRELLDRYNNDTTKALAAYNAGPGAVDRYGSIPPYPETEEYVRRVISLYEEQPRKDASFTGTVSFKE